VVSADAVRSGLRARKPTLSAAASSVTDRHGI
jgi:hypothetical protein